MDSQHEETVLRITAQYIAELQAGQNPKVSEYIARYPQYADEIISFVTYYQAVEADIPTDTAYRHELASDFHIAIEYAWESISRSSSRDIPRLSRTAKKRGLSLSQLAQRLRLSTDIVTKLEQGKIEPSSVPLTLIGQLANVLQQPMEAIQAYLASTHELSTQKLAESPGAYAVHEPAHARPESFRQALEESTGMSEAQKLIWLNILDNEG